MKRVFLIVLDSFGIGAAPDAKQFGDSGANTLESCAATGKLHIPNMISLGLSAVDGVCCLPKAEPNGIFGRLQETSQGKDTTIGHWELMGVVSQKPLPTYPNGFPKEVTDAFCTATGRGILANAPWSGTAVIEQYGEEHMKTGDLIVYTSADSVFQIAAHEEIVPIETLYDYCRKARAILQGKHGVGRVIARPFVGEKGNFRRTANRHDFSLEPPQDTLLDNLKAKGFDTIGIGKIYDIFAGRGLTEYVYTKSNQEGMEKLSAYAQKDFRGLCFANLVDFDMQFGHRRDAVGYAEALNAFDAWLGQFLAQLGQDDAVIITADHGCDPNFTATTDHTRECVPLLVGGKAITSMNLGTKPTFTAVADMVKTLLEVEYGTD